MKLRSEWAGADLLLVGDHLNRNDHVALNLYDGPIHALRQPRAPPFLTSQVAAIAHCLASRATASALDEPSRVAKIHLHSLSAPGVASREGSRVTGETNPSGLIASTEQVI